MFGQPSKLTGKPVERLFALCFLNRHLPDRRSAKWDGRHYVSHCLCCGKRIRRKAHNTWRRDWLKGR